MYSKYHTPDGRRVQIPENYSGCAFSDRSRDGSATPTPPHRLDIAKPTPPEREDAPPRQEETGSRPSAPPLHRPEKTLPPPKKPPEPPKQPSYQMQDPPIQPMPLPPQEHTTPVFRELFEKIGVSFPFSHGIGFDELLILGLILLLSQNEADSDLILWLVLLLFCG